MNEDEMLEWFTCLTSERTYGHTQILQQSSLTIKKARGPRGDYCYFCLTAVFLDESGSAPLPRGPPPSLVLKEKLWRLVEWDVLRAGCHPTIVVKALKGIHSTDLNQ